MEGADEGPREHGDAAEVQDQGHGLAQGEVIIHKLFVHENSNEVGEFKDEDAGSDIAFDGD